MFIRFRMDERIVAKILISLIFTYCFFDTVKHSIDLVFCKHRSELKLDNELKLLVNETWGPKQSTDRREFRVDFSYSMIADLVTRLEQKSRPIQRICCIKSVNTVEGLTEDIIEYWRTEYDFKKREKALNRIPQFIYTVQGIDIHYYHSVGTKHNKISNYPVLILHGMSSSPVQFIDIMYRLSNDKQYSFDVVTPSLPGFGYSDTMMYPDRYGPIAIAHLMHNFMKQIGYDQYYVQGNELGAEIAANMAVLYPNSIITLYSTMCRARADNSHWMRIKSSFYSHFSALLPKPERSLISDFDKMARVLLEYDGHVYRPIPTILRRALVDSPIALAGHLIQYQFSVLNSSTLEPTPFIKETNFTHEDFDRIIDNIMFYWVPNKIASSLKLSEGFINDKKYGFEGREVNVPTICHDLGNFENRMPAVMLMSRFANLKRKIFSLNTSTVLSNSYFTEILGDEIVKNLISVDEKKIVFTQYILEIFKMFPKLVNETYSSIFLQMKQNFS